MLRTLATVDIGSNTAHMLIARTDGKKLSRSVNRSEWLALGQVVQEEGRLPEASIRTILSTIGRFRAAAAEAKAEAFYVFATEAMRAADNHEAVMRLLEKELGAAVDLVTPRREAEYGLRGALLDTQAGGPILYLELGGGSLQVANAEEAAITQEVSLPLGTGRLIAATGLASPCGPELFDRVDRQIQERLLGLGSIVRAPRAIASGGVARGVWRALHPDGGRYLAIEELDYIVWATRRLTASQIVRRFHVKEKRAATLLPGALVYRSLLLALGLGGMTVSEYGVREGALLELAAGRLQPCLL
ncbi:MAG: hypothetical protein KIS66_07980 [Fimbriimonadaceae bacterium]|nr:hypothetical protein [Fimbriimonadaceae bacterium]